MSGPLKRIIRDWKDRRLVFYVDSEIDGSVVLKELADRLQISMRIGEEEISLGALTVHKEQDNAVSFSAHSVAPNIFLKWHCVEILRQVPVFLTKHIDFVILGSRHVVEDVTIAD